MDKTRNLTFTDSTTANYRSLNSDSASASPQMPLQKNTSKDASSFSNLRKVLEENFMDHSGISSSDNKQDGFKEADNKDPDDVVPRFGPKKFQKSSSASAVSGCNAHLSTECILNNKRQPKSMIASSGCITGKCYEYDADKSTEPMEVCDEQNLHPELQPKQNIEDMNTASPTRPTTDIPMKTSDRSTKRENDKNCTSVKRKKDYQEKNFSERRDFFPNATPRILRRPARKILF